MGCTKQDVVEASDTADAKWDYIGLKPSFFKKVDADLLGLVGLIDQGEPSDILAVEALRILKEWEYEYDPDFPGRISPGEKLVPPQWQAYYDDPSWRKFYKQLPCGLFGNIHSDEQAGLQYAAFVDLMLFEHQEDRRPTHTKLLRTALANYLDIRGCDLDDPVLPSAASDDSPNFNQQPVLQSRRVKLFGDDCRLATVDNKEKRLTKKRYKVVSALVKAGRGRLTKDELCRKSGCGGARDVLDRLRKSDPDWNSVIHMGKSTGGGYGID